MENGTFSSSGFYVLLGLSAWVYCHNYELGIPILLTSYSLVLINLCASVTLVVKEFDSECLLLLFLK
jgi:hypothetical protein